jgi:hypothetical protein
MKTHELAFSKPDGDNPRIFATVRGGTVTVVIRGSADAMCEMSLHDWYTFIEQSRKKVLMQGDVPVDEKLRDFSQIKAPVAPPKENIPYGGHGIDGMGY